MRIRLVFESMFGNTKQIAEAVADGMSGVAEVTVEDVAEAPRELSADVAALVVGGPTHAFSMSRLSTRREAAGRGAAEGDVPIGIREWMQALPDPEHPVVFVAFDTKVDMPLMPGAASHSATRYARKRGFRVLEPQSFLVEGYEGPLVEGELERARRWGEGVGRVITGE
ncbi:flavodoxin family protein [Microbacterium rhizosphaerae]|uniref:Flavodoxin/nitric oxide synthase n=1 Tax=Microbacterium rhizosphaerae TaxID=1678237 RepID=A0ABZ0SHR5_9MICO|nr:flavodoxin/nitric oxide synthase [Microbacterium rhizosphaerae]WPR88269.1 flavodoxin/nitric oxide synthase [Microbacterium rhizosphaerae]